jgi:hypothetical protein
MLAISTQGWALLFGVAAVVCVGIIIGMRARGKRQGK